MSEFSTCPSEKTLAAVAIVLRDRLGGRNPQKILFFDSIAYTESLGLLLAYVSRCATSGPVQEVVAGFGRCCSTPDEGEGVGWFFGVSAQRRLPVAAEGLGLD